jgi:hypothetical protein
LRNKLHDSTFVQMSTTEDQHKVSLRYHSQPLHLAHGVSGTRPFNSYEQQSLLHTILKEIPKHCASAEEAAKNSPVYRLKTIHSRHYAARKFGSDDILVWLHFLRSFHLDRLCVVRRDYVADDFEDFVVDDEVYLAAVHNSSYLVVCRERGLLTKRDVQSAVELLQSLEQVEIYQHLYVFGERFSGRGYDYRESEPPSIYQPPSRKSTYGMERSALKYIPSNERNHIEKEWWKKEQFSSWLKYRRGLETFGDIGTRRDVDRYAQLNFSFRFRLACDPVLNGIPIASVVTRCYTTDRHVDKIDLSSSSKSFPMSADLFVPCTNIYGCAFGTSPINVNEVPINFRRKYVTVKNERYTTFVKDGISHIYMIPLHPNKFKNRFERESIHLYNGM